MSAPRWSRRPLRRRPTKVSQTEIEATLLELWRELLGADELGLDDDFFVYGGDSMGATWVFAEVEVRLGIERPVSLLLEAPTIRELAHLLANPVVEDDVVVPIHPDGERPILVAVHGGFGGILWAGPLAEQLGPDQPVYGIRPPTFTRLATMQSIPDLARHYLDLLDGLIGQRAPLLFGYSYGGLVAFEMALQLQAAGRPAGLVAIGDMPFVELSAQGRRIDPAFREHVTTVKGRLRGRVARPYLIARQRVYALRRAPWEQRVLRRNFRLTRELRRLLRGYRPTGQLQGDLVLLRSTTHQAGGEMGWTPFVSGAIDVVDIACPHSDMIQAPHNADVARSLAAHIDVVAQRTTT